jgi:hypothetical protein
MNPTTTTKEHEIAGPALAAGIVRARTIKVKEQEVFYLKVDPETEEPEFLKKEAASSWLLYIFRDEPINNRREANCEDGCDLPTPV